MPAYETAKGIVVDIGMDVSGLKKALGSINTETSAMQRELKQVERLLKLDPSNTELLAQKQKLLTDSVQNTTVKLAALESAQKQLANAPNAADEATQKEYRLLQREIVETQKQMKDLSKELEKTDESFKKASKNTGNFQGNLQKLSKTAADVDEKLGGKLTKSVDALGVAAAAVGVAAAKSFLDFDKETTKVLTLLDQTVLSYDAAKDAMLDWSVATATSANDVASAMYEALSAGVQTADVTMFMEQATKTAVAGFTDAATSVDILTSILNSYGMEVSKTTEISDKLLVAQDKGKLKVGEFASSIGNVVGIAAQAGVSFDDLAAATAAITTMGPDASKSMNDLKSALSNIIKPTAEAEKMAHQLRLGFDAQSLSAKGLSGFLEEVQRKTGGNVEKMAQLFGSVEALNAVMILTGNGSEIFADTLDGLNNSAGRTEEVFNQIASSPAFKFDQALTSLSASLTQIGQALTPLIFAIAEVLKLLAKINPEVLTAIVIITLLAVTAFKVFQIFQQGKSVFDKFNSTAKETQGKIMLVVVAVVAVIAVITVLVMWLSKYAEQQAKLKALDLSKTADEAERLQRALNGMPSTVPTVPKQGGSNIPRNATGTNYFFGGKTIVGEYGPEIVDLPKGSRVYTASQTQRMASESTATNETYYVNIDAKSVKEFNDIVRIAKQKRQRSVAYGR